MKQFTGSDEYWDRAIEAQLGLPEKQPGKPDPKPDYEPVPERQMRSEFEKLPTDVGTNERPPVNHGLHMVER